MLVSEFDFDLPSELIAQAPMRPRDGARLLHAGDGLHDHIISDLPNLLDPGDLLVCNDTRVIPARLTGRRGEEGGKVEVTLMRPSETGSWQALARPAKKLKLGDAITFAPDFSARVIDKGDGGEVTLEFNLAGDLLQAALEAHGVMPLPPYIKRGQDGDNRDRADYQTAFAQRDGAVAAPTAGLHFTDRLLAALADRGVGLTRITLHVGPGTFLPVRVEDTSDHRMHAEWGEIDVETADAVNAAKAAGGRIIAIGSTSLRLLETAAGEDGRMAPFSGDTDIFITPGYRFKCVDRMLTNFHLPKSTLFMLVAAFAGLERMQAAYGHAIQSGYRFYSYGDACLLEPAESG